MNAVFSISDLHIGEGRKDPFEHFTVEEECIQFLHMLKQKAKSYGSLTLILNGDFLETQTFPWLKKPPRRITEDLVVERLHRIFDSHKVFFDELRSFAEHPKCRLVYTIGNHDIGMHFPRAEAFVKNKIPSLTFAGESYREGPIYAEHGHQYFRSNHYHPSRLIGEKEGIRYLRPPWAAYYLTQFLPRILSKYPSFLHIDPRSAYTYFSKLILAHPIRTARMLFTYGMFRLNTWIRHSNHAIHVPSLSGLRDIAEGNIDNAAKQKIRDGERVVIFGHTHVPRELSYKHGIYLNTGTWTDRIAFENRKPKNITKLSYAQVEYDEKRWSANLHHFPVKTLPLRLPELGE